MRTAEARPRQLFGYVAGNSALDNGAGDDSLSGCDTEIRALRDAGCYADFTFPSLGSPAQPRKCNVHYYATEDGRPKSHHDGVEVAVGRQPAGDLLIFQGPIAVDWGDGAPGGRRPRELFAAAPAPAGELLSAHVHVAGRPEWIFVKTQHARHAEPGFVPERRHGRDVRAPWKPGGTGRRSGCTTSPRAKPTTSSRRPRPVAPAIPMTIAIISFRRRPIA